MRKLLATAVVASIAVYATVASAQTATLSNPFANEVVTVFVQALAACTKYSDDTQADLLVRCLGVRVGVLDVYQNTAELCMETLSPQDCVKAQQTRKDTLQILKALKE